MGQWNWEPSFVTAYFVLVNMNSRLLFANENGKCIKQAKDNDEAPVLLEGLVKWQNFSF